MSLYCSGNFWLGWLWLTGVAVRAGRVSSPCLHCCGLRTRDINIFQELGGCEPQTPELDVLRQNPHVNKTDPGGLEAR